MNFLIDIFVKIGSAIVEGIASALGYQKKTDAAPAPKPETAQPTISADKQIGVDETKLEQSEQSNADKDKATTVAERTRTDLAVNPDRVMSNDPFNLDQ